jgi:hypothetical protein
MRNIGPSRRSWPAGSFLLAFAVAALVASPAAAHSGDHLGHYGTAKLGDGKVSAAEYGGSCIGPKTQTSGTVTYHFTICETNDTKNDYWGIKIDDPFAFDAPVIWFDNNHDGKVAAGVGADQCALYPQPVEDFIGWSLFQTGVFVDSYYCKPAGNFLFAFGDTGQENGAGSCTPDAANTKQVCELSHPLNSGDSDDYGVNPLDTLGWCFTYDDKANNANAVGSFAGDVQYPAGCFLDKSNHKDALNGNAAHYGDVQKRPVTDAIVQALKDRLQQYLATCQFCPPDPTRDLLGEVRVAINQLNAQHRGRAVTALQTVVSHTQRFVGSRQLPAAGGRQITNRARALIARIRNAPTVAKPGKVTAKGPRTVYVVTAEGASPAR